MKTLCHADVTEGCALMMRLTVKKVDVVLFHHHILMIKAACGVLCLHLLAESVQV